MSSTVKFATGIAVAIATVMFTLGAAWLISLFPLSSGHIDWQEPVQIGVLLGVLPVTLAGLRWPRLARDVLAVLAVVVVCLPLTITNTTGLGPRAIAAAGALIFGVPLAVMAGVFWLRMKKPNPAAPG